MRSRSSAAWARAGGWSRSLFEGDHRALSATAWRAIAFPDARSYQRRAVPLREAQAMGSADDSLDALVEELRLCRVCRDAPRYGGPPPHEPRPVIPAASAARLCIASPGPGVRVHASGR